MKTRLATSFALLAVMGCSDDATAPATAQDSGCASCADSGVPDAATDGAPGDAGGDATLDAPAPDAAGCDLSQATGVAVADVDLDGFPPYAVDACRLAYVSLASGELRVRDLSTGAEQVVAPKSEAPRRPTMAGDVLAWEADEGGKSVVRVRSGGVASTIVGGFDHAGEPRATSDAVVFTGWLGAASDGDTDVFLFEIVGGKLTLVAGGKGQQRFADVSATHVVVSDFSEDPSGTYSGDGTTLADLIVIPRGGGSSFVRKEAGKQAFPMLGSAGSLVFMHWPAVHPVPKLQEYALFALPLATPAASAVSLGNVQSEKSVRPTVSAGVAEWVQVWGGKTSLMRAAIDGATPATAVTVPGGGNLHAPAADSSMTVLATDSGGGPTLVAIPR